MKTYENRIVLYLYILGFKKIIDATIENKTINEEKIEKLYQTLELIKTTVSEIKEDDSAVITQFSDLIIVSFKVEDTNKVIPFFESIMTLNMQLISRDILCRGTITYGPLFHNKDFIFGPALVEAYQTEKSAAIYPRIILDKSVLDIVDAKFSENLHQKKDSRFSKKFPIKYKLAVKWPLKIDTDEKHYFDYFHWSIITIHNSEDRIQYLSKLRDLILRMNSENKKNDPGLQIKYGWMKNKFNNFLSEYLGKVYNNEEMTKIQSEIQKEITKIE